MGAMVTLSRELARRAAALPKQPTQAQFREQAGPLLRDLQIQSGLSFTGHSPSLDQLIRLGELPPEEIDAAILAEGQRVGLGPERARETAVEIVAGLADQRLKAGEYRVAELTDLIANQHLTAEQALNHAMTYSRFHVSDGVVAEIENGQLKLFLIGQAQSGIVSSISDIVAAFVEAGYFGRTFPVFDPSKRGAPVRGYGVVSRQPIRSHAPFETPDVAALYFDGYFGIVVDEVLDTAPVGTELALLINTPLAPGAIRERQQVKGHQFYTLDAGKLAQQAGLLPHQVNYVMLGALMGLMGDNIQLARFQGVLDAELESKFSAKVATANKKALRMGLESVRGEKGDSILVQAQKIRERNTLGEVEPITVPVGQERRFDDGNKAIAWALKLLLNIIPAVVAAYPITPQTQIVEWLAHMMASLKKRGDEKGYLEIRAKVTAILEKFGVSGEGILSLEAAVDYIMDREVPAVGLTPESEHGAGEAVFGAASEGVLGLTTTSSQGAALMFEVVVTIAGCRLGNALFSNVTRSLNAPLDVECDHGDFNRVFLNSGLLAFMTYDVQSAADFHLMALLAGMYAEYIDKGHNILEMVPHETVMLPSVVASDGFEVSHAPEDYLALTQELVEKMYHDPRVDYLWKYFYGNSDKIIGALQINDARMDTDLQRHDAMKKAYEVLRDLVFPLFAEYTGRLYNFLTSFNVEESDVVVVVMGATYSTFVEVAQAYKAKGINVGVVHPNVLRPLPKKELADALRGKTVIVMDRDDNYGAAGAPLYLDICSVINEFNLAKDGTKAIPRVYGLGGRTMRLPLARDIIDLALRHQAGEARLNEETQYVGANV